MAKNELQRHKCADMIKWVVIFLLVIGLIGCVVALFVKLDRQTTTETLGGEAYSVGTIDAAGAYKEGDTSIYTRKAISVDGLKCVLKKDAAIKYQIFFYDGDDKFLSASDVLTADYDGAGIPKGAETCKIMITPTADEDGKVSFVEVLGYANQLTVTVNR